MGGVAYGLRRLSKGAQEASAHPLTVAKAGFLGDFLDRQPSLLEQISGGLKTKILDGAGRRLTSFCAKHPVNCLGLSRAASASCSTVRGCRRA